MVKDWILFHKTWKREACLITLLSIMLLVLACAVSEGSILIAKEEIELFLFGRTPIVSIKWPGIYKNIQELIGEFRVNTEYSHCLKNHSLKPLNLTKGRPVSTLICKELGSWSLLLLKTTTKNVFNRRPHPGASDNNKQDKYQKDLYLTMLYLIAENQRQKDPKRAKNPYL